MLYPATALSSLNLLARTPIAPMYSSWIPLRLYQKLLNASNTAGLASRWLSRSTWDGRPSVKVAHPGAPLLYARSTPVPCPT